jgi:hypothetical protein
LNFQCEIFPCHGHKEFLNQGDATLIMRALALVQSPSVPGNMVSDHCLEVEEYSSQYDNITVIESVANLSVFLK